MTSVDIDTLFNNVKDIFAKDKITISRISLLLPKILETIEQVGVANKLSGAEKKDLLLRIIGKIVSESKMEESEREALQTFISLSLPILIDSMVYAYNSETFQKIKNAAKRKCLSCLKL